MQLSHVFPVRTVVFDDPTLVSRAGLVPAMALARRSGLAELADRHLTVAGGPGHAAGLKVSALVAGMVAGADSIADMAVLRHGGMGRLFTGVRAPSTLGTFLRAVRFGHVRQLDAVAARFLTGLSADVSLLDPAAAVTYVDMDGTMRRTYGYAKQGSGYGYSGVKGLNALLATASTAGSAPVIVATRLRKGPANSARGAARLVADRGENYQGVRGDRDGDPAGRQRLLRTADRRRSPPRRRPLLDHRPQGPGRHRRDQLHPRQ